MHDGTFSCCKYSNLESNSTVCFERGFEIWKRKLIYLCSLYKSPSNLAKLSLYFSFFLSGKGRQRGDKVIITALLICLDA